jgi:hypothetical protein
MGPVLGLDHHFQVHGLRWQISENTLMGYFHNISASLAQDGDNRAKLAWPVDDVEPKGERKFGNNTFQ